MAYAGEHFQFTDPLWKVSTPGKEAGDGWGWEMPSLVHRGNRGKAGALGAQSRVPTLGPRGAQRKWEGKSEVLLEAAAESPPRLEGWGGEEAGPSKKSLWSSAAPRGGAAAVQSNSQRLFLPL